MRKRLSAGLIVIAVIGIVAAGAMAVASSDSEGGVTGQEADRAVKAALEATGGGTANEVERDSEHGATWEVEVTKPDGVTVDVRLDEDFDLLLIEGDEEEPGGDDGDEREDEGDVDEDDGTGK